MQTELFSSGPMYGAMHSSGKFFFKIMFFLMINRLSPYYITQGMWCRGGRVGGEFDNDLTQ